MKIRIVGKISNETVDQETVHTVYYIALNLTSSFKFHLNVDLEEYNSYKIGQLFELKTVEEKTE